MTVLNFMPGARLDQAIASTATRPDAVGFAELLLATAARRIALTAIIGRRTAWTPRALKTALPTVVTIGDDAGDSRDPDEWRCAISAIAWTRAAIVHGTGAEAWHYREAIRAAELKGRCLLIETDSAHVAAWLAALQPRQIPVLSIIPPPGTGAHPRVRAGVSA